MKKRIGRHFVIALAVACAAGVSVAPARAAEPTSTPALKAPPLDPPDSLGRSMAKLKNAKALTIGYFGGSITAGAGASKSDQTSWRGLTTAWFKKQFPDAAITEINAAIGGTGSDLGAFRVQDDLLAKHPDLVFVEFAVNDGGGQEQRVMRAMEGIVRHIRHANPAADIIFLYTATQGTSPAYLKGELPKAVGFDHKIAEHYGIPEINVGYPLWKKITETGGDWKTLTGDTVHPNDAGYALCFDVIRQFLESHRADKPKADVVQLPTPLTAQPMEGGRLVDAWTVPAEGWQKEAKSLGGHYPHRLAADKPGTELKYKFTGPTIGLFWLMGPDSGDIEWSVDGGKPQRRSSWDKYCLNYARANYVILADDLPAGEHTLTIKVLGEKNEQSKGTWVRVGAFMVQ